MELRHAIVTPARQEQLEILLSGQKTFFYFFVCRVIYGEKGEGRKAKAVGGVSEESNVLELLGS